ncbi:MAG: hypothetical protein OES24_20220 [Acidimicrobiia bacterium]|nr:hypothetical protein [Acidimicrobiia bacterium]
MRTDDLGARFAQYWVRVYTSRLPLDDAADRRNEIRSDLWEHRIDAIQAGRSRLRHNLDVIERVLSGIPADLSWRRGIQQSHRRLDTGDPMTTQQTIPRSTAALIAVASLGIVAPFPFLALLGTGLKAQERLWILGSVALAAILAGGLALRLRTRRPVLSTLLLAVGAFAPSSAWFWLPPVYLVTAAIIIVAVFTARNEPIVHATGT